jgi:hypothetical protein
VPSVVNVFSRLPATGKYKKCVDMDVTLPQYLVLTGEPIPQVGLRRKGQRPNRRHLAREKSSRRKHFMATKKKAAKKKKKH